MKIDLGCGSRKKEGYFGIDCQALPGVDLICDCNQRIPLEDNVADEIIANDFLEHINNDKRIHIMTEIWRILKPGGIFNSSTPSSDGRGAFQDPTHYAFWNENSFNYYTKDNYRLLYNIIPKFDIITLKTTPMNEDRICWVVATLRAVKYIESDGEFVSFNENTVFPGSSPIETVAQIPNIVADPHAKFTDTPRLQPTRLKKFMFDTRQTLLLSQVDRNGVGLEIGASYSPVAPKASGLNVRVADYIDQEELRLKYQIAAGVDVSRIEPVDYVLGSRTLGEVITERSHFDYIIASHVIEHVPDLLGFVLDCQALLKPAGVLALAVPDKRACFDFLLPLSTTGQVLQAHRNRDRRPGPGAVFDFEANRCELDGKIAWPLGSKGNVALVGSVDHALGMAERSGTDYIDVHIWHFVPSSFKLLIQDLQTVAAVELREKAFLATSEIEFYCFLSRLGQGPSESRTQLAMQALKEQSEVLGAVQ